MKPLSVIRADDRVGKFTGGSRALQDVWFTMLRSHGLWALLGYGYWIAEDRQSGDLIAEVGFADFKRGLEPDISGTPEAGWIVAPDAWGLGYAAEAVSAIHDWLDHARPGRSTCIINPENSVSIHLAEKFGYAQIAETVMSGETIFVFERFSSSTRKG